VHFPYKTQKLEFSGFSVVSPGKGIGIYKRSVKYASIFSLEAMALFDALSYAGSISSDRITIFSDSKSVLLALSNINFKGNINYLIGKIRCKMKHLYNAGKNVQLIWIPSHCGILGNELADEMARKAIKKGINFQHILPAKDFKAWWKNSLFIKFYEWCVTTGENKATWYMKNCLTPSRKPWFHKFNIDRRTMMSICRMRSGHTALSESLHRFHIVPSPNCPVCNVPELIIFFSNVSALRGCWICLFYRQKQRNFRKCHFLLPV